MIKLEKGLGIRLEKSGFNLTRVTARLSWTAPQIQDPTKKPGEYIEYDLDAQAWITKNGLCRRDEDLVFYHSQQYPRGAVTLSGDDRTGGTGEEIKVNLPQFEVEPDVTDIFFTISINAFKKRNQNFGQIKAASIALVDDEAKEDFCYFDLAEKFSTATAVIVGSLSRENGDWSFNAVGEPVENGIYGLCDRFGIQYKK
jgi:tellurium resistance protein TerD